MQFVPITIDRFASLHVKANPSYSKHEDVQRLQSALDAFMADERCQCGAKIWVIGSAEAGLACFTCITLQAAPDGDYEIAGACDKS